MTFPSPPPLFLKPNCVTKLSLPFPAHLFQSPTRFDFLAFQIHWMRAARVGDPQDPPTLGKTYKLHIFALHPTLFVQQESSCVFHPINIVSFRCRFWIRALLSRVLSYYTLFVNRLPPDYPLPSVLVVVLSVFVEDFYLGFFSRFFIQCTDLAISCSSGRHGTLFFPPPRNGD